MIALAWIIFAAVLLGIVGFCWLLVRYYQDKHEAEKLPTLVTITALSIALLSVFIIPVDIYNVSSTVDAKGVQVVDPDEIASRSTGVRVLYYILYSSILAFVCGFIPFAYFYYEEDDERVTLPQKVWSGCKYTIILLVIVVILLGVGLFLFLVKGSDKPSGSEDVENWASNILKENNIAEAAIAFAIACLTVLGYIFWICYTAYGLSAFPIGIIKGKRHIAEEVSDLHRTLETTKEKARVLKAKQLGGKNLSKKEKEELMNLERQERVLARQCARLGEQQTGWRKILFIFKPFAFLFGFVFFGLSLLLIIAMLLTNIDKTINSTNFCGAQCGFVLAYPKIFNPLNTLLTTLSKYFPLDYIVLGSLITYIFFATLSGITRIGVRFLWVQMYKVRPGSTPPQGLLMACVILMFSILALNMELTTLAPQYATFGSQTYLNGTHQYPCSLDAPEGLCTMTQLAVFVNSINLRASFFGVLFYGFTWVFILAFLIGFIISLVKSKASNLQTRADDSDTDED